LSFPFAYFGLGTAAGAGAVALLWGIYVWASRRRRAEASLPTDRAPDPVVVPGPSEEPPVSASVDPPLPAPVAELARLSERVVVQLARSGRMDPEAPVRRERTQQGLAEVLASNQSAVSKVLRRLVAAEIVEEERRHIAGAGYRMKAYALTRRGELLAREVARRQHIDLLPPRPPSIARVPPPTPEPGRGESPRSWRPS
jgi:DNA-binding MarR family transcriptional regulator